MEGRGNCERLEGGVWMLSWSTCVVYYLGV
jgi:hypothetical protein